MENFENNEVMFEEVMEEPSTDMVVVDANDYSVADAEEQSDKGLGYALVAAGGVAVGIAATKLVGFIKRKSKERKELKAVAEKFAEDRASAKAVEAESEDVEVIEEETE